MTTPTNQQLREFILSSFNESEFDLFCFDYFEGVEHLFSDGMNMLTRVVELIRYCKRQQRVDELLAALERERPSAFPQAFTSPPPKLTPKPEPITQPESSQNSFIHEKTGLEFVRIPAGEFQFGEKKIVIDLPEFWISKTPVTFAVYHRFIQANPDYPVPFVEEDWAELYNWDTRWRSYPSEKANHPIVLVSWYDAVAFCEWAGLQLPMEEQWEKAARGTDGRLYPWGDNEPNKRLCNFRGNVRGTTPVGQYSPQGDSPYGCVDMSGNVWEWCLNKYDNPVDMIVDQSNDERVLRGGSWVDVAYALCMDWRLNNPPNSRSSNSGFRVVVVRPLSQ